MGHFGDKGVPDHLIVRSCGNFTLVYETRVSVEGVLSRSIAHRTWPRVLHGADVSTFSWLLLWKNGNGWLMVVWSGPVVWMASYVAIWTPRPDAP